MSSLDLKILVIDDDPVYHLIIAKILKNLGFQNIKMIIDSTEGLNYLITNETLPDILLLDINMPKLNGWELLDKMKCSNIDFTRMDTYIVTSSISKYDFDKSKEYNILKFLNKPVSVGALENILF